VRGSRPPLISGVPWQVIAYGDSGASVPPASTASVPRRISRRACASTSMPPAPSDTMTPHGPLMPCRIDSWPVLAA